MNHAKAAHFLKVLQDITGLSHFDNDRLHPVLEQMELMSNLMEDFASLHNPEELMELAPRIRACQKESGELLTDFLSYTGTSREKILEYFSNPNNLGQKQWDTINRMQQKLAATKDKPSAPYKIRRKKGRTRA